MPVLLTVTIIVGLMGETLDRNDKDWALELAITALSITPANNWQSSAACKGMYDLFFSEFPEQIAAAKAICTTCDVVLECARTALDNNESVGVWGGLSQLELRRVQKTIRRLKS